MYQRSSTSANRPEKWTAGCDYIRIRVDGFKPAKSVLDRIMELQSEDLKRASAIKPWKFQGYHGKQTDSIRYGIKGDRLLWESSGEKAASTMAFMGESGGRGLRCDLQTTFRLSREQRDFVTSRMRFSPTMHPTHLHRQTLRGLHTATNGLWLGTVGRRTSPSYLRIYDKGVESQLEAPGILWRVEVEAKSTHSQRLCQDHWTSLNNPRFCASYVASSVTRSGLRWPFSALGDSPVDIRLGKKERSTATQLAAWTIHTVAPTIPRLLSVYTVVEVLKMLNLSDVAAPIAKDGARDDAT